MMKRALLLLAAIMASTALANADTIGPNNCGTCLGNAYTLTVTSEGTNLFDVTLTVDTSLSTKGGDFFNAAAIKIVPNNGDILSITDVSVPAGFNPIPVPGGLNANGCNGTLDGFVCFPFVGTTGVLLPDGTLTFNADFQVVPGTLLTGNLAASVKALVVDSTGKHNGLTSEGITLQPGTVPEPSSVLLLGGGLLAIGTALRRRTKKA